jgi:hypothetical protein
MTHHSPEWRCGLEASLVHFELESLHILTDKYEIATQAVPRDGVLGFPHPMAIGFVQPVQLKNNSRVVTHLRRSVELKLWPGTTRLRETMSCWSMEPFPGLVLSKPKFENSRLLQLDSILFLQDSNQSYELGPQNVRA